MRSTQTIVRLTLLLPLAVTSCSWLMTNSIPKRPPLRPGTSRSDVIAALGPPRHTAVFSPPASAASLPKIPAAQRTAKISLRDEYFISGLVQTPTDPYASEDNIYPAFFIVTGGLIEVLAFPVETADLTVRSVRRYHLWLWYDPAKRLIMYERR